MRKLTLLYVIPALTLVFGNLLFAQIINTKEYSFEKEKGEIVQKLNAPTKIWVNGNWTIQKDGTRVWKKGYWIFEKKTFQQKSKILRGKINNLNKT